MTRVGAQPGGSLQPLTRNDTDRLRDLVRRSRRRKEERAFVVEGLHLVERALEQHAPVKLIAITAEASKSYSQLLKQAKARKVKLYALSSKAAEQISDTQTPQGIFAEIEMPEQIGNDLKGVSIALDRIQDPGNLGTIIRTAAWFGVDRILLSAGSADCYNPKVLRSTQGEIFSVGIREGVDLLAETTFGKKKGVRIIAATSNQSAGSIYTMQPYENAILIFGSEAHGVELSVEQNADERVTIPRFGAGESLNVATSVGIILAQYVSRKAKIKVNSYS